MEDGDGEMRVCTNHGECIYIFKEDNFQICPKCQDTVSYHWEED
jgi:RNA polymerase subunit RPABC4/transcription elongation factor Spt4